MSLLSRELESSLNQAAQALYGANGLYIGAGAGMGVDSGLPDFRGKEGFWNAYPPVAQLGLSFSEMANPRWFDTDPEFAWGFYGHRLNLYRATKPHEGFDILRRWGEAMPGGAFVFTSNVDGHFQKAGFDVRQINEHHGSVNHLQCVENCGQEVWPAINSKVVVDESTLRAALPLPSCPACGQLARPNILMFGDWCWDSSRSGKQKIRHDKWLQQQEDEKIVLIEIGAGMGIPSVRYQCESLLVDKRGTLIRINIRDSEAPVGNISLPMGGLEALRQIDVIIDDSRKK
jgi:NAD-dependent SIR2 family protein deacetylase|tara:strand:- start:1007 stop:1870 length:864 start_codon:yes stop_codon:yes gene_type:complete